PAVGHAARRVDEKVLDLIGDERRALPEERAVGRALPGDLRDQRVAAEELVEEDLEIRLLDDVDVDDEESARREEGLRKGEPLLHRREPDLVRGAIVVTELAVPGIE